MYLSISSILLFFTLNSLNYPYKYLINQDVNKTELSVFKICATKTWFSVDLPSLVETSPEKTIGRSGGAAWVELNDIFIKNIKDNIICSVIWAHV